MRQSSRITKKNIFIPREDFSLLTRTAFIYAALQASRTLKIFSKNICAIFNPSENPHEKETRNLRDSDSFNFHARLITYQINYHASSRKL